MAEAKAASNSTTRGPWAIHPDETASAAAAASSGPSHGRITGIIARFPDRAPAPAAAAATSPSSSRLRASLPSPPGHQQPQALIQTGLSFPTQPLSGLRDVSQPAGDRVDAAWRTEVQR